MAEEEVPNKVVIRSFVSNDWFVKSSLCGAGGSRKVLMYWESAKSFDQGIFHWLTLRFILRFSCGLIFFGWKPWVECPSIDLFLIIVATLILVVLMNNKYVNENISNNMS